MGGGEQDGIPVSFSSFLLVLIHALASSSSSGPRRSTVSESGQHAEVSARDGHLNECVVVSFERVEELRAVGGALLHIIIKRGTLCLS